MSDERSNKRMQQTKREHAGGGPASRAIFINSRFAADARCSTDMWKRAATPARHGGRYKRVRT